MKLLWQDVFVVASFLLYFGAGFSTNFVLAEVGKYTEAANILESNPTARKFLNYRYGLFILQITAISLIGGIYWLIRRNYIRSPSESTLQILSFYSIVIFLLFLQNFLNDSPIFLKLYLSG